MSKAETTYERDDDSIEYTDTGRVGDTYRPHEPTPSFRKGLRRLAYWMLVLGFGGLLAVWIASTTMVQVGLLITGVIGLALWAGARWL